MAITIILNEDLVAGLKKKAMKHHLSVEQFAISILTEAVEEFESVTPEEAVTRILATGPNPSQVRPATTNLADMLRVATVDPCFDLDTWKRQWSNVEAEMKATTRSNDVAESRGG